MSETKQVRVKCINWTWRNYFRIKNKPWKPIIFTRECAIPGCRSLLIGPYEFIWRFRNRDE